MKFKSNDPLQSLLREALHRQKVEVSAIPSKAWKLPDAGDIYQASSWKPGRPEVLVVHVDTSGLKTILGLFQEQLNSRAHGSRLLPALQAEGTICRDLSAIPRVEVHGDYWLQAREPVQHSESVDEVRAIKDRFHELLASYD